MLGHRHHRPPQPRRTCHRCTHQGGSGPAPVLDVEPVLTGIRAEVAQAMVGLGVQLQPILTFSTLQAGHQYALRRLGRTPSL